MEKVTVKIPYTCEVFLGKTLDEKKCWAKLVQRVDPGKKGGYMYEGPFGKVGQLNDLPIGGLLLIHYQRNYKEQQCVQLCTVREDGELEILEETERTDWALSLRNRATEYLAAHPTTAVQNPRINLSRVPMEDLLEELCRRDRKYCPEPGGWSEPD